jgi:hypothetical protein
MMIVSSPRPIDIQQVRYQQRLEMAIWSIVAVQVLEALILIVLLVRH